jgi:hypothetical protein
MSINTPIEPTEPAIAQRTAAEAIASPLPEDKLPVTSRKRVAVIWVSTALFIIVLNALVTTWLNKTVPNAGYRRIRQKWAMLHGLNQPVDTLILGDSSGAQGLDPEVLSKTLGGKGVNLCTIGDMTVVNSAAMLDDYVHKYGAPKRAVIVSVFDIWPRVMSGYAFGQTPLSTSSPDIAWYSRHGDTGFKEEVFLARDVKLFSESKSLLENLKETIKPAKNQGPGPRPDGFSVSLKPDHNQLMRDVRDHLDTAGAMDTSVSEDNAAAAEHILALGRQYHFPVYFVNAPISEDVMRDPAFLKGYQATMQNVQAELSKNGGSVVLPEPMQFADHFMDNVDHLTYEGAELYSARVATELKGLEAPGH